MIPEKEVELIENPEEISKIINEKIKNKRLIFTDWYKMGIMRKGISEEKFNEIFPQFEKIKRIEKETLKFGDIGYELFYKFSNNTQYSIGTIPNKKYLKIIHLIEYKRSLEKRFKKFKK
ncbi:hypothetical protein HOD75_00895 [archaeon]|jgi:hypothetical protein|nr:hypothetical protein [archaeon]MBT4241434.1 hypothetical protein [archaeon]MBT4417695.1 hypothetical protein [archaeon]